MEGIPLPVIGSLTPKGDGSDYGFGQGYAGEAYSMTDEAPNDLHAINAQTAAYHADVAAKHAASTANHATALAQWVQHLWAQHEALQSKVKELEDWKKRTLEDMRKLREEHKQLRKRLGPCQDDDDLSPPTQGVKKAVSIPVSSKPPLLTTAEMDALKGPPGLDPPMAAVEEDGDSPNWSHVHPSSSIAGAVSEDSSSQNEGVKVTDIAVDGDGGQRAEWRIGHLSVKLRGCMGRALVSPPFSAWGMEDLRLMIYPDQKESATGPRSRRQKELYNKKVSEGPMDGCLKLKVPNCPAPHTLTYFLTVGAGDHRKGPFKHNFAECTVSEPAEFGMDWLAQVDSDGGLTVSVDIMKMDAPVPQ